MVKEMAIWTALLAAGAALAHDEEPRVATRIDEVPRQRPVHEGVVGVRAVSHTDPHEARDRSTAFPASG